MGFLSDAPDDTPQAAQPTTGGFLSDNPPPQAPEPGPNDAPAPSWSEIPGKVRENFIPSAIEYGKNMVQGLSNLPSMIAEDARSNRTAGEDISNIGHAIGHQVMERYGSIDNFKRTLARDPVGVLGDFSMLMTGPENIPGVIGTTAKVARLATDPLTIPIAATKGMANLAGKTAAGAAGLETGVGMKPYEEAFGAGYEGGARQKTFEASRTGAMTGEDIVNDARGALSNIVKQKNMSFDQGMGIVRQSKQQMGWGDIIQAMNDAHDIQKFQGVDLFNPRGLPAKKAPALAKMRDELDETIIDWANKPKDPFHTAAGFDALKKAIGNIRDRFTSDVTSPEFKIANTYYKAIGDTIKKQVPEYGDAMETYHDFMNQISELRKTFSLPADQRKATIDTALRKLQSTNRRNVNTNFSQRASLLEDLRKNGAPNLPAALAGQALQSYEPHGIGRILPILLAAKSGSIPEAVGVAAASSPRAMGYAFNRAGQLARPYKYIPRGTLQGARAVGQYGQPDEGQSRGGKIGKALRVSKRHG